MECRAADTWGSNRIGPTFRLPTPSDCRRIRIWVVTRSPKTFRSIITADWSQGTPLPELVLEGGWPSVAAGGVSSTPEMQARYIRRHAQILDVARATAVFQITFTDLDLSASPPPPGSVLPLFAHLGLVDSVLAPKAALAVWDSLLALDLAP